MRNDAQSFDIHAWFGFASQATSTTEERLVWTSQPIGDGDQEPASWPTALATVTSGFPACGITASGVPVRVVARPRAEDFYAELSQKLLSVLVLAGAAGAAVRLVFRSWSRSNAAILAAAGFRQMLDQTQNAVFVYGMNDFSLPYANLSAATQV